ncbi:MAG: ubiquinone/menaquinone biosynthesis C-methylase UbiE [Myxococcota bacterium]|jgi:ubiquinone/menaquinone biosynthesis C-methylase UbiE
MNADDPTLIDKLEAFLHLTTHHRGEPAGAYDDAAEGYDLFAAVWDRTVAAAALRRFEALLVARTPPGASVLDVAAGTGRRTEFILSHTDAARVVALDASAGMLDQARRKISDPRVEFVHGSAQSLPFPDDSFDVVCSTWLLSILDEPRAAVGEFLRVLKPGGTALYAYCSLPNSEAGELATWLSRLEPEANPLTHMLSASEEPVHRCGLSTIERFALGFTTVVTLGKCCQVAEAGLPCRFDLPTDG